MPILFIGHGSPMNAIETNQYTESWRNIGKTLPKPRAILIFSAHWITEWETRISTSEQPEMIYDMGGFPPELYQLQYSAPGSQEIAREIQTIAQSSGQIIQVDHMRWFDHGVWSTLIHLFPDADIPVITMSLDYSSHPSDLVRLGESLAILRERWALIIGSGNIVHNLRAIDWSGTTQYPWAIEFDRRVAIAISSGQNSKEWDDLLDFQSWWDISRLAHPTYDHLLPLFPLMGASSTEDTIDFYTPDIVMGNLSMRSVVWR